MNKKEIRDYLLEKRKALSTEEIEKKSTIIINKLIDYLDGVNFNNVALYYPIHNEVNIKPLYNYLWEKGKTTLLPYSYKTGNMAFKIFEDENDLKKDDYGIPAPQTQHIFPSDLININIIPCVACDNNNYRLGYGSGFYDRFLSHTSSINIGVCFDFQKIDNLPIEANDIKLTVVITD